MNGKKKKKAFYSFNLNQYRSLIKTQDLPVQRLKKKTSPKVSSLSRRLDALKDPSFFHGIELFIWVIVFVEVSVGLLPGLCHCILYRQEQILTKWPDSLPSILSCVFALAMLTLNAMADPMARTKAIGRCNFRRLASRPLITGLGRDMIDESATRRSGNN